jgi:hypothetical protein
MPNFYEVCPLKKMPTVCTPIHSRFSDAGRPCQLLHLFSSGHLKTFTSGDIG